MIIITIIIIITTCPSNLASSLWPESSFLPLPISPTRHAWTSAPGDSGEPAVDNKMHFLMSGCFIPSHRPTGTPVFPLCTASTSHRKDSTTDNESEKSSADASLHSFSPVEAAWHQKPQSARSDWPACWATSEKRATQPSWVGSDVPSLSPCCGPAWHVSVGPPRAAKTQHQV